MPSEKHSQKDTFKLFDYFKNYKYFEEEFDYDEKLKLPRLPSMGEGGEKPDDPEVFNIHKDPVKKLDEISIGMQGMKIDREFYNSFRDKIMNDIHLSTLVEEQNFKEAEKYLRNTILNKPEEFFTLEKHPELWASLELKE